MILRSFFAASLSILLSGATLAGLARTFDWHKPESSPFTYDPMLLDHPAPFPFTLHPDAVEAKMPAWAAKYIESISS